MEYLGARNDPDRRYSDKEVAEFVNEIVVELLGPESDIGCGVYHDDQTADCGVKGALCAACRLKKDLFAKARGMSVIFPK